MPLDWLESQRRQPGSKATSPTNAVSTVQSKTEVARSIHPQNLSGADILALQSSIGNQAVLRLLNRQAQSPAAPSVQRTPLAAVTPVASGERKTVVQLGRGKKRKADDGVWVRVNKRKIEKDWEHDKNQNPGNGFMWASQQEYADLHKSVQNRSDKRVDPQSGEKYYESSSGKLYEEKLNRRRVKAKPSGLKRKLAYDTFAEAQPPNVFFEKGGQFFPPGNLNTSTSPGNPTELQHRGLAHVFGEPQFATYYSKGNSFFSDPAFTTPATPKDPKALVSKGNNEYQEPLPDKNYYEDQGKLFSDYSLQTPFAHPDPTVLKDSGIYQVLHEPVSHKHYYKKGADFYDSAALTTKVTPPDEKALVRLPVPMLDSNDADAGYESEGGDMYDDEPKLAKNPPPKSEMWDLKRKDREQFDDENDAEYKRRVGPMEMWDVLPYEKSKGRHDPAEKTEADHSPAGASLKIKFAKDARIKYKESIR